MFAEPYTKMNVQKIGIKLLSYYFYFQTTSSKRHCLLTTVAK